MGDITKSSKDLVPISALPLEEAAHRLSSIGIGRPECLSILVVVYGLVKQTNNPDSLWLAFAEAQRLAGHLGGNPRVVADLGIWATRQREKNPLAGMF